MKRRMTALCMAAILLIAPCGCKKNNENPPVASTTTAATTTIATVPTTTRPDPIDNPKAADMQKAQADNPEAFGWIEVPGTNINYPLLQSGPNTQEDFYLTHDKMGEKNQHGAIYIQKQTGSDFRDPNTIIYGHNMGDGTMFRHVHLFREREFFEAHDTIVIYIPGHMLTYRIYALIGYGDTHLLADYNFYLEEERRAFLDMVKNSTSPIKHLREEATPTVATSLITLSTCTNDSDRDERLLLIAKLESDTPLN